MSESLRKEIYDSPNPYNSRDPQIDDFFGYYPSVEEPDFSSYISRKKEFYELSSEIIEPFPRRGKLFKHQSFSFRYLTHYDRQLIAHEPATGKTCIMFAIAELFKRQYENTGTGYQRTVIIFKNDVLKFNLIDNLVCSCTDRIYETTPVLQASNEEEMKKQINKEIRKWYDFITYGDFNTIVKSFKKSSELDEYMSDKIFIVEEAHNIMMYEDFKAKPIEDLEINQTDSKYNVFFKALHRGNRNKVLLFTATPARNFNIEFRLMMNLVLPMEFQMPNWSIQEMRDVPFEEAEPYLTGRYSYIRAFDIGVEKIYEGERPENMFLTLYLCPMETKQYLSYAYAKLVSKEEIVEESNIEGRKQAGGVENKTTQASNLIYPDGSFGAKGAQKYLEKINDRWTVKNNDDGAMLKQYYSNPDYLASLSSKASRVVQICQEAYPRGPIDETKGIIFIYFPEFVYGSGAADLIPILEANGYEYFSENSSIFQSETNMVRELRPCPAKDIKTLTKSRLGKAARVAFIDSKTSDDQVSAILKSLNSYENRYGEYLQVIIVSEVGREGISISNAIGTILYGPSWNYTNMYQATERTQRPTSYVYRLEEYRKKVNDPEARFPIRIYFMAAVYLTPEDFTKEDLPENEFVNLSPERAYSILSKDNLETSDIKLYKTSEEKDRDIRQWMRYGKRADAGCWINYNRNVQIGDVDGSPACDYDTCAYECAGIREDILKNVDWTTKILYYSEEEIEQAKEGIKRVFGVYYSVRIDEIIYLLKSTDRIYTLMALEQLINERTTMIDRFGNKAILREENGRIYLDKDIYSSVGKMGLTIYNSMLIGTQSANEDLFSQYIANITINNEENRELVDTLMTVDPLDVRFSEILDSLDLPVRVRLFENIVTKSINKEPLSANETAILDEYSFTLFPLPEPIEGLEKVKVELSKRGKVSGRKPKYENKAKVKKVKLSNFQLPSLNMRSKSELVYVHRLFSQSKETTGFNATSTFMKVEGKLRLYKPSEEVGWRNLTQVENIAYNAYLQTIVQHQVAPLEDKFNVYGMILPPRNNFQIRDKETQAADADEKTRGRKRGKICSSWAKYELIELLTRINIKPPNIDNETPPRQQIIVYLMSEGARLPLKEYKDQKLKEMYLWYTSGLGITEICNMIETDFEATGRLFRGSENIQPEEINEQLDLESQKSE